MRRAKKPTSSVEEDVHPKLTKLFSVELAKPAVLIFNQTTTSKQWPKQWKIEMGTPIPKVTDPESEEDLRIIYKTSFLGKIYESFVADWLIPVIMPFLDPGQYGGLKGRSTNHCLIKLYTLYIG